MSPDAFLDVAGAVTVVLGCLFCLAAALGLVRFPDVLTRMHAATKPQVFGLILVLVGVTLSLRDAKAFTLLGVAVVLQILTVPVSSHLVSRAAHRNGDWAAEDAVIDELARDQAVDQGERTDPQNSRGDDG